MAESGFLPCVSILLSSKERPELLRQAVASLRQMDYPSARVEIVVVEESASPEDPGADRYVVLPPEGRGFAWSRNVALQTAAHPIVAFTDDDCVVDRRWLKELVAPLADARVAAVAGGVLAQPCGTLGKTEIVLGFPGGGLPRIAEAGNTWKPTRLLSTVNAAARREILEHLGGFAQETGVYGGEDSELFGRLVETHEAVFNPKALVYHRARDSAAGLVRWLYRRGIAAVALMRLDRRRRARHLREHLRGSITLRLLTGVVVLWTSGLPPLPVVAGLAVLYYALMLTRYRFAWNHFSPSVLLLTPVTKTLMDAAFEAGRLRGMMLWATGALGREHTRRGPAPAA